MSKLPPTNILFYYLSAFSHTGGIEKFNRCFIKVLDEFEGKEFSTTLVSVYDDVADKRYSSSLLFKGFSQQKRKSLQYVLGKAKNSDVVVIGHINLAIAGILIKLLNPKCRLIVIGHGIDVWKKFGSVKKLVMQLADTILAVSNYTKNQLVLVNRLAPSRIRLFPNAIDPFFTIPDQFNKPGYLLDRYSLQRNQPVMLTLSRLLTSEREKGYDAVIAALPEMLKSHPGLIYILAGRFDEKEKTRIQAQIEKHAVSGRVLLPGFINETEVVDHYLLSDIFILASRKEGFGIVFLEALSCGVTVIGGNQDGSSDALANGELGSLINPIKQAEIATTVVDVLSHPLSHTERRKRQAETIERYHFNSFRNRLTDILRN